jgi:hypothetical protein
MAVEQDRYFDAGVSIFTIYDGTAQRDISPYITELRGLPGQIKVNDVTSYGSVGERPGASIYVAHFTLEMLFNMVTDVGTNAVMELLFEGKVKRAFVYSPAGVTAGNLKITGDALLVDYTITGRVGSQLTSHAELHVDNGVTLGVNT